MFESKPTQVDESPFSAIVDITHDAIISIDQDQNIVFFNKSAEDIFGYKTSEILGESIDLLIPESFRALHRKHVDAFVDGEHVVRPMNGYREVQALRKDGAVFYAEVAVAKALVNGNPIYCATLRDVTDRIHSQELLQVSEERFKMAVEGINDGLWDWDLLTDEVYYSPPWFKMLGYDADEFEPHLETWAELVHPDDKVMALQHVQEYVTGKTDNLEFEMRMRHKEGRDVFVLNRAKLIRCEPDGKPVRLVGTHIDITERVLAREQIKHLSNLRLALSKTIKAVMDSQSKDELLQKACRYAVEFGGLKMAWAGLIDEESGAVRPVAKYGNGLEYLEGIEITTKEDDSSGRGPTGIAVRENRPYWCQNYQNDPLLTPWQERGAQCGWCSSAAIPIHSNGKVMGAINFYADVINAFDEEAQSLLLEMVVGIEQGLASYDLRDKNNALEKDLQESEAKLNAIIEASPVPIALIDEQERFIYLNNAFIKILGYTLDDIPTLADWWPRAYPFPKYREALIIDWQRRMVECKRDGKAFLPIEDADITCKDGLVRNFIVEATSLSGDFSETNLVTLYEFTEQKNAKLEIMAGKEQLKEALSDIVRAMSAMGDAADPYTAGHESRVAEIAAAIALEMGLNDLQIEGIRLGALIHDIGKISAPIEILSKQGKLTEQEYSLIKLHAQTGYDIIKGFNFIWPLEDIIHQHHERMDGTGYPQGLKGSQICLEARIVAIADVVEAISSHRPYRPDLGLEIAINEIKAHRGSRYWPDAVDAFLRLVDKNKLPVSLNAKEGE